MADATRNVTYVLSLVNDEASNRTALDAFLKAQDAANKAREKSAEVNQKALDKEVKDAEAAIGKKEKAEEAARVKREKEQAKAREKEAKEAEKQRQREEQEAKKQRDREAREAEKAAKEQQQLEARVFQARIKLLAQIADKRRRDEVEATAQHKASVAVMQQAQEKFRSSVMATSDSILRVGRGLALLGASGDENLKRMLDSLVKIQAAFDIAKGGVELYYNISEAVKAYRASVVAATTAEQALAAARAASASAGSTGSVTSAASGATSRVGGIGGAAATVGGGFAAAGAIVGAAAAAAVLTDALRGTSNEAGSFSRSIFDFEDGLFSAAAALFGFESSLYGAIDAAKEEDISRVRANEVENRNILLGVENERFARMQQLGSSSESFNRLEELRSRRSLSTGTSPLAANAASLGGVANRMTAVESMRLNVTSQTSVDEILALDQEMEKLAERQIRLTEERYRLEQAAAQEKRDAATFALQAAEQEKQAAQDILRTEKERQQSVLERFGQMSRPEQMQLLALRQRAEAVGPTGLSVQERQQLRSIGTVSAERIAREGDIAAGTSAGGLGLFRAEDYAASEAAREQLRQANLTIQDQRRIEVQVDADLQNVTDEITTIFEAQYAKLEVMVAENIRAAAERETQLFQARNAERMNAQMQGIK